MTKLLLLASAAALVGTAPAIANAGPGHGKGHVHTMKGAKRSWTTACPKGLVWRGPVCVPPGHKNRLLAVGSRVPTGWSYTPWGTVPTNLRSNYNLDPAYRYIYRDNVVYVVDPRTRLITSILSSVL